MYNYHIFYIHIRLVKNGQIEIVTGGWVMNDEANTHYAAMINQLTEGHLWLQEELGVTLVITLLRTRLFTV